MGLDYRGAHCALIQDKKPEKIEHCHKLLFKHLLFVQTGYLGNPFDTTYLAFSHFRFRKSELINKNSEYLLGFMLTTY